MSVGSIFGIGYNVGRHSVEPTVVTEEVPVPDEQLVREHEALLEQYQALQNEVDTLTAQVSADGTMEYLGEFDLTAYCFCSICCGRWANNRPVVDGQTIVFTSSGVPATEGVTMAVDPTVIPYGTKVYIEGVGVRVAQDSGSEVKGNRIDVYFSHHDQALESELGHTLRRVWIINE